MSPWIRLALKEFWLPFHYRKSGCPGGRDFVWLTTFMALILTLLLLLLASREGLLNRFVDVLLGNVPGQGVSIAVTNNMLSKGGVNAIDSAVLSEVRALEEHIPGMSVYPYRALEASLYPLISLPDEHIWNNKREDGSKFGPDFNGWAVYNNDPLWSRSTSSKTLPLEVIISRTLFYKYFNYEAYRNVLKRELPEEFLSTIPPVADKTNQGSFHEIWLHVKIGFSRELLPFQVTWVDRFPVIDKIAYVFPLATYHALKAAHDFPELRYFPEGNGDKITRIKQFLLAIHTEQNKDSVNAFCEEFTLRFGAETKNYRGDRLVILKHALPEFWIEAYARQYNLQYEIMEEIAGDAIKPGDGILMLPCGRLPEEYLRDQNFTSCADDQRQPVALDVTTKGKGYHHVLVYIPDRTFLSAAKNELVKVKDKALSIHPTYQDALNRFGFLSEMLETLEKPYSWFLVIFLVSFLGIQIGTLIGHHRHRYGILLAKGMEWWQIYAMLWLQILLALVFGMIVAVCIITIASISLQSAVKSVAEVYTETLSLADLNLLPLTCMDYLVVAAAVFTTALVLATVLLYLMPLRRRTHPAMLL